MLKMLLSDSTFKDLRNYIYDISGIYIADTKKYLIESRLSRILQEKKLTCYEDYFKMLKVGINGNELSRLFDAVTTNETYFFREPHQFELLLNTLFPKIMQESPGKKIKIWSAACSTGEEPYTMAMMLNEKFRNLSNVEIYASDISEGVLSSAKKAMYNSYSVRNVPENYMKKYFSPNGQMFDLNPTIKQAVKFMKINLIDDKNIRNARGVDIIFCRNVLIYFDVNAKQKVVSNLYDNLNPGGRLIIGSSESLHNITRAFRPHIDNKVIVYHKV
ncbi:MAG: protein-glutamate O-methyltransferase CheR [Nitrospira sp.]|nr:protein-glutamate O-methyltransferase CheR [Candidatus Brocadiales bacterium]MBL7048066.1 protein-glutamate O-methyltransferase CheR [Nitrospira sp.]